MGGWCVTERIETDINWQFLYEMGFDRIKIALKHWQFHCKMPGVIFCK